MTAIAGISEGGHVWIGGDSAGVAGYSLQARKDPKVFKVGEFIIGYTSSFRMGQILRYHLSPPKPTEGQDDFEYMVCSFVDSIRKCLKSHGYMKNDNSGDEKAGTFLVGRRGKLYRIENDLQVAEMICPYASCGCGDDLVLGSLHATEEYELTPKDRIELALSAAEQFSAGVRSPFTIVSSKDDQ